MNTERAIFLHIPKTAGTTLYRIIDRQYPPQSIYTFDEDHGHDDLLSLSEARRAEIRMLRGHMIFGPHSVMPGPSTYFTLLREPVERVISNYYFARSTPTHHHHDLITSEGLGLEEFVESGVARIMTDNGQTRMLSGRWSSLPFGGCTEEALGAAKEHLRQHFVVVGLLERFDETLLMLKRALGWENVYYYRENVGAERLLRDEQPQTTLDLIAAQNPFDLRLYQYGKELFDEQVRRQGPSLPQDVRRFQRANWWRGRLMRAHQEARRHSVRMWVRGAFQGAFVLGR